MALKQAYERISQIQLAARGTQEDQLLLETALRLHAETSGRKREQIAAQITYFMHSRDEGNPIQMEKARREMKRQLAELEIYLYADSLALWPDSDE